MSIHKETHHHTKYSVNAPRNSSTFFPTLLGLTDRVSLVMARRSGAADTAVDTLRRRAGSMINQEEQTLGVCC